MAGRLSGKSEREEGRRWRVEDEVGEESVRGQHWWAKERERRVSWWRDRQERGRRGIETEKVRG